MRKILIAGAVFAAGLVPVLAQDIAPERREAFIAMVAAEGCTVAEDDADRVMDAAGFTYTEANDILDALMAEGVATFDGAELVLDSSVCTPAGSTAAAPAAPDAPSADGRREEFIAVVRGNGCTMTEDEADLLLPAAGFDKDESRTIARALMSEGLASAEGDSFALGTELCGTASGAVAAGGGAVAAVGDPTERFLALVRDNNCALTEAQAEGMLAGIGMTMEETIPIVNGLLDAGKASFSGGVLTLNEDVCLADAGGSSGTGGTTGGSGGPSDVLAAHIRSLGCTLTEDGADAALAATGLTEDQAAEAVQQWMADGLVTFDNDVLQLGPELCQGMAGTGGGGGETAAGADALFAAIRDNGCSMSEAEAEAAMPALGLTMEEAEDIATDWIADGKAAFENSRLVLTPDFCASADAGGGTGGGAGGGADADRMAAAIRENGCSMTGDEAETELVALGFTEASAGTIARMWIEEGLASFEGDSLVLGPELCAGAPAGGSGDGTSGALSDEDRVAQMIRGMGCSATRDDGDAIIAALALDEDVVDGIVEGWMEDGRAAYNRETRTLTLSDAFCAEARP